MTQQLNKLKTQKLIFRHGITRIKFKEIRVIPRNPRLKKPVQEFSDRLGRGELSQPQPIPHFRHIFSILAVHLIQIFQANAVFLRNGMHGIAVFYNIDSVRLSCLLTFSLQVNDIASLQRIIFLQVIILHQLPPTDAELLPQELESISIACYDVSDIVGDIDLMRTGKPGLLLQFFLPVAGFALAHAPAVIFIKLVILDNRNQTVGIRGIGGISRLFQSSRPTTVIRYLQLKQESIPGTPLQEQGMVVIGILRITVGTKALVTRIVVMTHGASSPIASALDAEMVIALAGQFAITGTALKQPLRQRDTGRYLMFVHLLYGKRSILFDIFVIPGVPSLRLYGRGSDKKCYDSSQSESPFHASIVEFDTQKSAKELKKPISFLSL